MMDLHTIANMAHALVGIGILVGMAVSFASTQNLEALESQDRIFGSLFAHSGIAGIRTIVLFLTAMTLITISLTKILGDLEPVIKSPITQNPEIYKKKSLEEWEQQAKAHPDFESPLTSRLRIMSRLNLL